MVSILCITYNHAKFIEDAIKGFLIQERNFDLEIIIGDDASSDGTIEILKHYKNSYPSLFNITLNEVNIGMMKNLYQNITKCKGKYIAICEGDDYWIDSHKLQKQINFLEANPDYSICFHRVSILEPNGTNKIENLNSSVYPLTYTIEQLAKGNFMHTPSVVFRNHFELPSWFIDASVGDYVLHMLNAMNGKIYYLPDVMAVYRKHQGGVWSMKSDLWRLEKWISMLELLLCNCDFSGVVKENLINQYANYCFEISMLYLKNDNNQLFFDYANRAINADKTVFLKYCNELISQNSKINILKKAATYEVQLFFKNGLKKVYKLFKKIE